MQEPPAVGEVFTVGLEVIAVGEWGVIVFTVFEVYGGVAGVVGGGGDDAREVVAAAE